MSMSSLPCKTAASIFVGSNASESCDTISALLTDASFAGGRTKNLTSPFAKSRSTSIEALVTSATPPRLRRPRLRATAARNLFGSSDRGSSYFIARAAGSARLIRDAAASTASSPSSAGSTQPLTNKEASCADRVSPEEVTPTTPGESMSVSLASNLTSLKALVNPGVALTVAAESLLPWSAPLRLFVNERITDDLPALGKPTTPTTKAPGRADPPPSRE
mmetsp:Transcript_10/g.35  ORF Transcript_10/g.35 Transcript_10/m.35 type:complete len:220 (-) Transcript_10:960-1619(-)